MISGRATAEGTARLRERLGDRVAPGHFRRVGDLWLSSIGLGTYLGEADEATDRAYEEAIREALAGGVNVFDTAINYRHQRSERSLGRALAEAFASATARRDEVFVATKAGFLPFDGRVPRDPAAYLRQTYLDLGLLEPPDVVVGSHALAPRFLADQLDRSRANLDLETVDLFYLHNPETQLEARPGGEGLERIARAIGWAGEAQAAGWVGGVGLATWDGLRVAPGRAGHLPLFELLARVGGESALAALQLPLNLAMPEALAAPTQEIGGATVPALVVARHAGLEVFASASILQGRLAHGLPEEIGTVFADLETDAQRALQFTRSAPGVTCALVGMSSIEHVRENLVVARSEPAGADSLQRLFAGGVA